MQPCQELDVSDVCSLIKFDGTQRYKEQIFQDSTDKYVRCPSKIGHAYDNSRELLHLTLTSTCGYNCHFHLEVEYLRDLRQCWSPRLFNFSQLREVRLGFSEKYWAIKS